MIRSRSLACAAVLALTASASCHDGPTTPQPVLGIYVLRSISGAPVPFTYSAGPDGTYSVLADTVQLDASFDAPVARVTELVRVTGSPYGPDTTYRYTLTTAFSIDGGGRIEFVSSGCSANADCAPPDTGRVVAGGLVLGSLRTGTWTTWRFTHIAGRAP